MKKILLLLGSAAVFCAGMPFQVLAAEAPDPEMKRAEMQMEKVQGEEMQVQAAETWKKAQAAK